MSVMREMINPSEWDDQTLLMNHLARALNESRVAVVLGAGISKPLGLPDWPTLIERLYESRGEPKPASGSLPAQAEYLFSKYFKDDPVEANKAVSTSLYRDFLLKYETLRLNATMSAIGSLVMSSVRGRATSVITFNFDDLLEAFLEFHGFVVHSVGDPAHLTRTADAVVYHPHGLLPIRPNAKISSEIVFDKKRYSQIVGDERNPWRQVIVSTLRTRLCLFIGLSGDDDNLDSILVRVQELHGYANTRSAFWGVRLTVGDKPVEDQQWTSRGVYVKKLSSFDDLPTFLFNVCQTAAQLRSENV
jgi:hypothetical protein